jgi:PAS domain S-box-containing protein
MRAQFSSHGIRLSWRTALLGIVVIKAILSLAVNPGSFQVSYSGISYFLLLLLATSFAIRNAIHKTLGRRRFWVFLGIACGLWGLHQSLYLFYELGLHVAVPDNSISDTLLFFHIVPLIAAVASLPYREVHGRQPYQTILNSLLILFFWVFLYGYIVFPYQYLYPASSYGLRFDILYLLESLVLILTVGILTLRTQGPWKSICVHVLGASTLYTFSSAVANLAIDSGGYVNGKLYGLGLTASVCWFVWIPLQAWQLSGAEITTDHFDGSHGSHSSVWAMLVVVMISIPIVWELLERNENPGLRTLRLLIAVATIVCLASAAYITEYFARRKLASDVNLANEALCASEERLRAAQWAARIGTFDLNIRTGVDRWQPETEALYGLPPGSFGGTLTAFEDLIHPNDRERVIELTDEMIKTGQPAEGEWRAVWPDGSVHWIAGRAQVFMDESGEPSRMLGVNMDITERKRAEEALSDLTRKLVEAQEQERARIARELHDDINQRLALLAIELEQLKENPSEVERRVQELWKQTAEISNDVQALAHDLHSSQLEYLGAVAAMKSWCKEFGERGGMQIDCSHDVRSTLPAEIGLCLFRVLQEAVHNAAKHSGVKRIEVQLHEESGTIHLIVKDFGKGFDVEAASKGKGLGLTSMRERVRLVNGTIAIESKPMGGTIIHARVLLESEYAAKREAV